MDQQKLGALLRGVGTLLADDEARERFAERVRTEGADAAKRWLKQQPPVVKQHIRDLLGLDD